jgi:LAS superfamily LD-carboxypeptidase LdcB
LQYIPFEYAGASEEEDAVYLRSSVSRQDAVPKNSVKTAPGPFLAAATPDVDEALRNADESLGESGGNLIADLSISPGGAEPTEPGTELMEYPHYIEQNSARYLSFLSVFPDLSVTASLALVNVNADYGYYNGITAIGEPDSKLVLCNKNFQLPTDFVPQNLRAVAGTPYLMEDEAAAAFESMKKDVKDELGLPLVMLSGYRDYSYQKALYARYAKADGAETADTYSARAGHSEHQTGLAVDFLHKSSSGSLRAAGFQNTAQYAWLQVHAHEYGYILRYPEGYESVTGYRFEPWHWRYIGVEDATRMVEEGFATFEEYIGTFYIPGDATVREAG